MLNSTKAKTKRIGIRARARSVLLRGDCAKAPATRRSPAQDLEPQLFARFRADVEDERGVDLGRVGEVVDRRVLPDIGIPVFLARDGASARPVVHGGNPIRLQMACVRVEKAYAFL